MNERQALLSLNRLLGGQTARFVSGWAEEKMTARDALRLIAEENLWTLRESLEKQEKEFCPEQEEERCGRLGVELITYQDDAYPRLLRELSHPPLALYLRGTLLPLDEAALAIVGSRHPTLYGIAQARKFGFELSEKGLTIVSGLAKGIDAAAHQGSLQSRSGHPVAVLGCGIDRVYPQENRKLYDEIAANGALVSEYPLGTLPLPHHFPKRNRIIAGLSWGTLVVEARRRSGSLITAKYALESGREVFAMPGRIDQSSSDGCHDLLRDGACLADGSETVLESLKPMIGYAIRETECVDEKTLQEKSELNLSTETPESRRLPEFSPSAEGNPKGFYEALLEAELAGKVKRSWNGLYQGGGVGG